MQAAGLPFVLCRFETWFLTGDISQQNVVENIESNTKSNTDSNIKSNTESNTDSNIESNTESNRVQQVVMMGSNNAASEETNSMLDVRSV
jgi:hypothetical protein